jgi:hypothetical protein
VEYKGVYQLHDEVIKGVWEACCRSGPKWAYFRAGLERSGADLERSWAQRVPSSVRTRGWLSLFVGTSAGLENLPMPHFVGVTRPPLSEPWWIYCTRFPDDPSPEVDPLRLMTPKPYQNRRGRTPVREREREPTRPRVNPGDLCRTKPPLS